MNVIIDTSIISQFFSKKGPPRKLMSWMVELKRPAISVVTVFEIEMGLKSAGLAKPLALFPKLLDGYEIEVIEFSAQLSKIASDQGSKMKKEGRTYSLQDLWIGATAKANGCSIATANTKDFEHWEGVEVFDPLLQG